MSEREFSKISGLPVAIQPIAPNTIVEIETADGQSFHAPFSALGGMPASHGSTHQDGGSDEIGTEFPTANAIPKADDAGQLTDWVADASTSVKGKVQLAANNESAANKAVQSNDTRMSNPRPPTAHAASHLGGTDDLGLGTAALLDVGVADGVCPLNGSNQIDSIYLPSYVDDVIEVANYAALPVTGEIGKIYVTLDDNLTYRWTGSAYVEISKSLALGETSSTAYRGDRGKTAYDHSQAAHAPSNADNTQGAINAAVGETSVAGNDRIPFIDNGSGGALKTISIDDFADAIGGSSGGGSISVDNTSRVAEYTGDGIPMIPDNVAGRTYFQDAWATTDGWDGGSTSSVAVANGKLIITANQSSYYCAKPISSSNKMFSIRVKASRAGTYRLDYSSSSTIKTFNLLAGVWTNIEAYVNDSFSLISIFTSSGEVGDTLEIDWVYIGTGAYDTPALDRAGNGNNLTLNAVTPVNGKYGKEMSFNGSTSYAQASSPVIGTTGTVAVRFKLNTLKDFNIVYNNYSATTNGVYFRIGVSGQLVIRVNPQLVDPLQTLVTGVYYTYILQWDGTTIRLYKDGSQVYSVAQSSPHVPGTNNLTFGRDAGSATNFSDIVISHWRDDSRVWTADEALAWSLNPSVEDSLSMSETPSAGAVMLWASRYSLGTRALSTTSTTSTAAIPAGEWYVSLIIDANTTGAIKVQTQADGWIKIFQGSSASVQTVFYAGLIKSDGTNVNVERVSGSGTVYIDRINVG